MKIMSGNSNRPLAEAIAAYLDMPLTRADVKRFADMEVFVEIQEMFVVRMCLLYSPHLIRQMII